MSSYYVTTANYGTIVAVQANTLATSIRDTLVVAGDLQASVETANNIAKYANATANYANLTANTANYIANYANATANIANVVAFQANATANIANLTANTANYIANYANLTANIANITANIANVVAFQANATANIANITANIANVVAFQANATANIANITANYANATANIANVVAFQANATANIANLTANTANLTANYANLTANTANYIANYANATANIANLTANTANYIANYANATANIANLTANIANITANYANITANYANATANIANITANYANNLAFSFNDKYSTLNSIYNMFVSTGSYLGWIGSHTGGGPGGTNQVLSNLNVGIRLDTRDGIGSENAANTLEVNGTIYATKNVYANGFLFGNVMYVTGLPISSQWTTGTGNIYILNSNVGIGTTRASNALDVIGNVFISGNLTAGGDLIFNRASACAYYYWPSSVSTGTGDYIVPFSSLTCEGTSFTVTGDKIQFTRTGLYNIMVNIQGIDQNNEFDSISSVSVVDETSTLVFRDAISNAFGTQKQTIIAPLNVTDKNKQYQVIVQFFRNSLTHTISSGKNIGSYILIVPLTLTGITFDPGMTASDHVKSFTNQIIVYSGASPSQMANQKLLDVRGDLMVTGSIFTADRSVPTIQFDSSSQDVRVRNSNLYVKSDDAGNTFSVGGNVFVNGNIYSTGLIIGDVSKCTGLGGQWTTGTGNIYILNSNVGIGTTRASNALDVIGNVFISGNLITDISKCSGFPPVFNQWAVGPKNTVYLNSSNVGIGTGSLGLSNALEVAGNVIATNIIATGKILGDISATTGGLKQWNDGTGSTLTTQQCINYPSNVRIGTGSTLTAPFSNSLDVIGNVFVSGNLITSQYIYGNVSTASGLPFIYGLGNVYSVTANVGIGTSRVSNALDVVGNVFISGRLSANTQIIVACSDENSFVYATSPIITFRTPSKWLLTACPRITVKTTGASGTTTVDVTFFNGSSTQSIFTGGSLSILNGSYSSVSATQPGFTPVTIPDDALVSINVTSAAPGITGLKIIFYYMIV